MKENDKLTSTYGEIDPLNPDASFKNVTVKWAEQLGLKTVGAEFQHTTLGDLILHVPDDKKAVLPDTAFSFFRMYNVVEFKSLSDKFNPLNFLDNVVRTCLFQQQKSDVPFEEILNVNIVAFYPREFFKFMRKRGCRFRTDKNHKWLRWGNAAGHDIAIVIGRYLPVEKPYYRWLLFSQSTPEKLREFAIMLHREGEKDLLEDLVRLKPREVYALSIELKKDALAEKQEELQKDYRALATSIIELAQTLGIFEKSFEENILPNMSPEQLERLSKMIEERKAQIKRAKKTK